MTFLEAFTNYENEIKSTLKSANLKYQLQHIKSIKEYVNLEANIEDYTRTAYTAMRDALKAIGNSNNTINKKMIVFKSMLKFNLDEYDIDLSTQQDRNIKRVLSTKCLPKEVKHYNNLLTSQIEQVKTALGKYDITKDIQLRNKVMILLMLSTGVRRNECVNIKVSNIHLTDNTILLETTKTGQPRYIFVNDEFSALIGKLIKTIGKSEYLFVNYRTMERLDVEAVKTIFIRLSKDVGFTLSPHMLRHTYATESLNKGLDIHYLSLLMGHTNIKTTEIYLHSATDQIKKQALAHTYL